MTLGEYEGGRTHPLLTSPSNKPVTTTDVYDYVQHYSELRMIRVVEEPLMVSSGKDTSMNLFIYLHACNVIFFM